MNTPPRIRWDYHNRVGWCEKENRPTIFRGERCFVCGRVNCETPQPLKEERSAQS